MTDKILFEQAERSYKAVMKMRDRLQTMLDESIHDEDKFNAITKMIADVDKTVDHIAAIKNSLQQKLGRT
jgi:tetrahydromethanopterin S-methyltransferase subunit G